MRDLNFWTEKLRIAQSAVLDCNAILSYKRYLSAAPRKINAFKYDLRKSSKCTIHHWNGKKFLYLSRNTPTRNVKRIELFRFSNRKKWESAYKKWITQQITLRIARERLAKLQKRIAYIESQIFRLKSKENK